MEEKIEQSFEMTEKHLKFEETEWSHEYDYPTIIYHILNINYKAMQKLNKYQ